MENEQLPKPKSKLGKIIKILFILLILAIIYWAVFYYLLPKLRGPKAEPKPRSISLEKDREVKKIVSPAGEVLTTQGSDGTLYSLTVPPGAVVMPVTVTLTPMSDVPFSDMKKGDAGNGVYVGPPGKHGMTFIRPAYLTIKPNTSVPQKNEWGDVPWGRCNIGSRGYDPEICAGNKNLPFGVGVDPGKVVLFFNTASDNTLLTPTVPTGEQDSYSAAIWQTGTYMADTMSKKEVEPFLKSTFSAGHDYVNETEVLTHYGALGGDLEPYKKEIARFAREKTDYPREVLKGSIIALAVSDKEAAKKRVEDFKHIFSKKFKNIKGTFLPWPRYVATLHQVRASVNKKKSATNRFQFVPTALAQGIWQGADLSDWEFDGLDIANEPYDVDQDPGVQESRENDAFQSDEAIAAARRRAQEELNNPNTLPEDRADAAEVIRDTERDRSGSGRNTPAPASPSSNSSPGLGDDSGIYPPPNTGDLNCDVILKNAAQCKSMEECERWWDFGKWFNCKGLDDIMYRKFAELLARAGDCNFVMKTLATYGMQFCNADGSFKEPSK
jgi:hypothetical protein